MEAQAYQGAGACSSSWFADPAPTCDEGTGVGIVRRAVIEPLRWIAENAGEQGYVVVSKVADLPALLTEAHAAGLKIEGLMSIPPADIEPASFFALLDELAERHGLPGRSMGMSGDYEAAIAQGSTILRVGASIFGGRRAI